MSGYTGQFSFGHAAFFGIGAYTSSILLVKYEISPWIGLIFGFLIALLIGLLIGFLSFRYKLKGAYFTLATLAFAEIIRIIVENTDYLNSTLGISLPLNSDPLLFQFESRVTYLYVIMGMLSLLTLVVYKISRSKLGFNLVAIRENEAAAQSLGVNTFKNKMIAIGLSSGFTAIGGTFYAQYILYVQPPTVFASSLSVEILLPAIIGGIGTVMGPIIGSIIITPLGEITSMFLGNYAGVRFITYGLIIILIITYLPQGIVGWYIDRKNKVKSNYHINKD